jgi:hypothetical protein
MQYAGRLPNLPATRTMLVCVIALLVGAVVATGAYALIDGTDSGTQATKYIVVEQQANGSAEIPGKNEATTAAVVGLQPTVSSTDETATAASVSQSSSGGIVSRGSKATSSSSAGTVSENVAPGPTRFSGHY